MTRLTQEPAPRRRRPRIQFDLVVLVAGLAAVMVVSLWQIGRALLAIGGWLATGGPGGLP